jgi:hypothetical protein
LQSDFARQSGTDEQREVIVIHGFNVRVTSPCLNFAQQAYCGSGNAQIIDN